MAGKVWALPRWSCLQVAERVASECVEVYSGCGFTNLRDSKIGKIYEGTSFVQLSTIAKLILGA